MTPEYLAAHSLEEALEHLRLKGDKTKILAGGTDVLVQWRTARMNGDAPPDFFLDVTHITDLQKIAFTAEEAYIGAAVTFRQLEIHPDLQKKCPLLSRASSQIGSLQVRHLATLGGNVGTASPAGDGITPLVALSAEAIIGSMRGNRSLPVADLITGPGKKSLETDELIIGFSLKMPSQPE
jgi:CO/xanthine dehydrogenase FAD-binding subunit